LKGLTQGKLAELSGVSQSLIARIEKGSVNPSISMVRTILSILYEHVHEIKEVTAYEICRKELVDIFIDSLISQAIDIMNLRGISQLPVKDSSGLIVGSITEKALMAYLVKSGKITEKIGKVTGVPFPLIRSDAKLKTIKELLNKHSALLVEKEHEIVGIITNSDLLRYFKETA
jgi:predicted transcriptional regulator